MDLTIENNPSADTTIISTRETGSEATGQAASRQFHFVVLLLLEVILWPAGCAG